MAWARSAGIIVASDECYAEFTFDESGAAAAPVTALAGSHDGVLSVHSLSKRSNMAGFRVGFVAGDPELVQYLGEVRKHGGMMMRGADAGRGGRRARRRRRTSTRSGRATRRRRATMLPALETFGLVHDGGSSTFYLWLRPQGREADGWAIAARAGRGRCCSSPPGDLYGPAGHGMCGWR